MSERGGQPAILAVAALAGAALLVLLFSRFPAALVVLAETLPPLLSAVTVVLASFATGTLAIQLTQRSTPPQFVEAFLIGVASFGTLAGLVAWGSVKPLPFLTVGMALVGMYLIWKRWTELVRPGSLPWPALLIVPPIILAFLQAVTPVIAPDELVYKLAVPHAYHLNGRMVDLPLNSNSYLAMSFQLTDLAALMLAGGIAAKLVHFAIYLGALIAIYRLAERISPRSGWWALIVLAYTPALMMTAGWAFNDWGVLGLLALSFDRYHRWMETKGAHDFAVAFAALGAAASAKYTALLWIAAFGLLLVWRHRREPRILALATLIGLAFGSFFYIRNAVWSGSPVAPFLLPDAPAVQNYRSGVFLSGWMDLGRGLDVVDPDITDEALGIFLPIAFLSGLLAIRNRERVTRDLLVVGGVQMVILLTIAPGSRNMINGVFAVALPGVAVLMNAWQASATVLRALGGSVAAIALTAQTILSITVAEDYVRYLDGRETVETYVARTRAFGRPYGWIEGSTPRGSRVLMLGETRGYYLTRPFVSGGNLDGPRVASWLARFRNVDELAAELRRMRITHVLLHARWYRVSSPSAPPVSMLDREFLLEVSPSTDALLTSFLQSRGILRYRDGEYLVFELR